MRPQPFIISQLRPTVYVPSGTPIEIMQQIVLAVVAREREVSSGARESVRAAA